MKTKVRSDSFNYVLLKGEGGYLVKPFEVKDGRATMTYFGNSNHVKKFLQKIEKRKLTYEIVSLQDARFPVDSPPNLLTEKQKRVLAAAYDLGYYDLPKRISSRELADKLGMLYSALSIHRIKAER